MKEHDIIRSFVPLLVQNENIVVGPGDDCAAVAVEGCPKLLLTAADQLIENIHYDPADTSPEEMAGKLLKRNLSDIAAMGGRPSFANLTIATKHGSKEFFHRFLKGMADCAKLYNVSVCGGDISSVGSGNDVFTLNINGFVDSDTICLRKNAMEGDYIYVTGLIGNSYRSRHHLNFIPRLEESEFLAGHFTNTMIDVSDGLLADLGRICEASGLAAELDISAIPLRKGATLPSALSDGEDYELLFAVDPELSERLDRQWNFDCRLSRIGQFKSGHKGQITEKESGRVLSGKDSGFDHFQS